MYVLPQLANFSHTLDIPIFERSWNMVLIMPLEKGSCNHRFFHIRKQNLIYHREEGRTRKTMTKMFTNESIKLQNYEKRIMASSWTYQCVFDMNVVQDLSKFRILNTNLKPL